MPVKQISLFVIILCFSAAFSQQTPELIPYRKGDKWGYCSPEKKIIIEPKYDAAEPFKEGFAVVHLNGKAGFVNKNGKEITPLQYDFWTEGFKDGLARVELNGMEGFIDTTGKEVIPLKYDDAFNFSEGLALVKLNSKCGYIDKTGKEIIPLKYNYAGSFTEGLAWVSINGKCGYSNRERGDTI